MYLKLKVTIEQIKADFFLVWMTEVHYVEIKINIKHNLVIDLVKVNVPANIRFKFHKQPMEIHLNNSYL